MIYLMFDMLQKTYDIFFYIFLELVLLFSV